MSANTTVIWSAVIAFAALAFLLALNRLIRRSLAAPRIPVRAGALGIPYREVRILTERGKTLFGWLIPAGDKAPALVVLHGWGGNAEMMLPLAAPMHDAGYTLLFIDARCHGRSDEDDFSSMPRFAEDLEKAVDWLVATTDTPINRIGLVGHSVGAAATLLLASRREDIAAVVSIAAFAHPASIMRRWLDQKRFPYWPLGAYILFYVQRVIGHRFDDIAPCNTVGKVRCPVLLVHGIEDEMVPVEDARQIHAKRRGERTQLLLIPGRHDDYGKIEDQIGAMIDFLDTIFKPGG